MSDSPQFKRTDKAIIHALITLLNVKPFEKITVQDILDETPVTRATFYAHYRDKYEIAEKMMEHFMSARGNVRRSLASPAHPPLEALERDLGINQDFARALMKIHTEKVDFRKALAGELEREYLESSSSATRETEARIYAQAYVELYISLLNMELPDHSPEQMYRLFATVALRLLNLNSDREASAFMERKIKEKFSKYPK